MSRVSQPQVFVLLPPAWSCLGTPMDSIAGVSRAGRAGRLAAIGGTVAGVPSRQGSIATSRDGGTPPTVSPMQPARELVR